jgi:hypothetical protein
MFRICMGQTYVGACRGPASEGMSYELPYTSKFLVLAAYICSRNKASVDRRLFHAGPSAKRRRNALASDRQVSTLRHMVLVKYSTLPQMHRIVGWCLQDGGPVMACMLSDSSRTSYAQEFIPKLPNALHMRISQP